MADEKVNSDYFDSISRGAVEVCRIMIPDDANIAGNVHGGTTLKLIEEAGFIIATRHCNKNRPSTNTPDSPIFAALVRVEKTDFLQPLYIGEVVQVHAELSFASKHSLEVKASVWAENLLTGARRLTNRAALWYVAVQFTGKSKGESLVFDRVVGVPVIENQSDSDIEKGRVRYEYQKRARVAKKELLKKVPCNCRSHAPSVHDSEVPTHSVSASQSTFIHTVQPSECGSLGFLYGGVTMKMMDELAGIVVFRHCQTNVVTASVDAIDFHEFVRCGSIVNLKGQITFISSRSMEVEVIVDAQDLIKGTCYRACSAFFTYVSLDPQGRPQAVPPIELQTDEERQRYKEGKKRYEERKKQRNSRS